MPCLFSPPSGRPARGQVLLLALARHGPDMDELVSDLKRLDPAGRFEIPQRLEKIFLEVAELLGPAAAELVQIGHAQRVGRGVAGIKAVQPQRQGLAPQPLARYCQVMEHACPTLPPDARFVACSGLYSGCASHLRQK